MTAEPLSCPKCGGAWTIWKTNESKYYVDCDDCGFKTEEYPTEAQAVEAWNNERPQRVIDVRYLFQCSTCRNNQIGGCTTYCEYGESYRPDISKIPAVKNNITLPCNVGEIVYVIDPCVAARKGKKSPVVCCEIGEFCVTYAGTYAVLNGAEPWYDEQRFRHINIKDFENTIFLTRKGAEVALKEKQE